MEIETDVLEVVKKDGKNQRRLTRKEKILQSELGGGADASTLRKREYREIPQEIWDLFQ